jgi:addiction module HigA family antidote
MNDNTPVGPIFDPPHVGEFITATDLEDAGRSAAELATAVNVAPSTLSRLLSGKARWNPEMAIRLEEILGASTGSWLRMQAIYDEWHARNTVDVSAPHRPEIRVA